MLNWQEMFQVTDLSCHYLDSNPWWETDLDRKDVAFLPHDKSARFVFYIYIIIILYF